MSVWNTVVVAVAAVDVVVGAAFVAAGAAAATLRLRSQTLEIPRNSSI